MADNENFEAATHDLTDEPQLAADSSGSAKDAPAPERLRVHSLARVLGTTSRRIIDALVELDGRTRSAHSTVGREEADRVREVLAEPEVATPEPDPEASTPEPAAPELQAPDADAETVT
ncbi:MAG: ribonuclease E/G, partial [Mycolicibacterium sp.]